MTVTTGLGAQLFVDQYDLTGDVGAVDRMAMPSGILNFTNIGNSAMGRGYAHVDGALDFTSYFNDAASQDHVVLKAKSAGADRVVSFLLGSTIGNMGYGLVAKQINYDGTRGADGSLTFKTQCVANGYGGNYTQMLTAGKRTDTAATNGTSHDNTAATANGLVAYIHLFAFTGTSVTIKVQESSDNGGGDAFADVSGITSGALTTPQALRVATSSLTTSVERYLRVVTTGTFSNAVFAVHVSRFAYAI